MRQSSCTQVVHSSKNSQLVPGNSTLQHSHVQTPSAILLESLPSLLFAFSPFHNPTPDLPPGPFQLNTEPPFCWQDKPIPYSPFHLPEPKSFRWSTSYLHCSFKRVAAVFTTSQCHLQTPFHPIVNLTSFCLLYACHSHIGL